MGNELTVAHSGILKEFLTVDEIKKNLLVLGDKLFLVANSVTPFLAA